MSRPPASTRVRDDIVEIAVVTLDIRREPIQAWHSLVNPGRPIPSDATAGHRSEFARYQVDL